MPMWIAGAMSLLVGYLLGAIPFGVILTRAFGAGDLRQIGSGNIGATNVLRTGRKDLAALTLLLDAGKAARALENIREVCRGKPVTFVNDEVSRLCGSTDPRSVVPGPLHATNVMPALIDAALANCTLGEMVQAMGDIYGRYSGGPEW